MQNPQSNPVPARLRRVGFLVGSPKIGGAERQVWHLAHGLVDSGQQSAVMFMERAGRRPASACLDFGALAHVHLGDGPGRRWLARRKLRRELARLDAVVAMNLDAMEMVSGEGSGVRIGSVRGLGFTRDEGLASRMRRVCADLDLVTCNSPAIVRALREIGVHVDVEILPNVVPESNFRDRSPDGILRVLFVGNLVPVKQPEMFVGACVDALKEHPDIRVTIAGDGPLWGEVAAEVSRHGDAFNLLGHVPPESVPYGESDVVVSSSLREGCSNALLEGMAAGCAIIATRAGGNVDLVEESGGGILVPVDGRAELAAALGELARDPQRRVGFGERGRAYVAERHTRDHATQKLLEMIDAAEERRVHG